MRKKEREITDIMEIEQVIAETDICRITPVTGEQSTGVSLEPGKLNFWKAMLEKYTVKRDNETLLPGQAPVSPVEIGDSAGGQD